MKTPRTLTALGLIAALTTAAAADERTGWTATLSKLAHNVSGTVTIVDADTLRVDNFYYDGGGIDVFFYLGVANDNQSFKLGIPIGDNIFGHVYNGESLEVSLPEGQTLDGWNAVSVWCVTAGANFGSGAFVAPPCSPDLDGSGTLDLFDFLAFTNLFNDGDAGADCTGDETLDLFDFLCFTNAFNAGC